MTEGQYRDDPEPSGPLHHTTGTFPVVQAERETRIPPWAVTTIAVACATAGLITWGEVRFVLRTQYDIQQGYRAEQMHLLEERVAKHEELATRDARDYRELRERFVRIEERLDAIADKLGVAQNGNGSRRQ
jgi:hypothetical protein